MTEKRYFKRMWEEEYYIFDSETISEKVFDEKVEYEDYRAFADSLMGDEVVEKLNELNDENQDLKSFNQDLAEELSVCANARISKDNRIKRLEEKIQRERTSFTKTHERWSKEAENKIKELSEENEQLKSELDNCKECLDLNRSSCARHMKENEQLKQSNKDAWELIQFIYNEIKEDGSMEIIWK